MQNGDTAVTQEPLVARNPDEAPKHKPARLTDERIRKTSPPPAGARCVHDCEVPGFAARITARGVVAFVLSYRIHGRQRRYTIGGWPEWSVKEARDRAIELRRQIRDGQDPLARKALDRAAPLVTDLAERYLADYAEPNNRPSSIRNNRQMLDGIIRPNLGRIPVAAVTKVDIERLHRSLHATPYRANRVLALLSKMFSLAIEWGMRPDNPALGIARCPEQRREKWLRTDELERLVATLREHPDQQAANAIRLLLYTGARKREVLDATWGQFDVDRGTWMKPSAHTKQKRTEFVPLSEAALRVLRAMKREAESDFLFPGRIEGQPLENLRKAWTEVCESAALTGVRIHDLRHTYASHLVSSGVPLAIVGKLLGHTQSRTTERYAHLADEVLRKATNRFSRAVEKAASHG